MGMVTMARLQAVLRGPALDADLAAGIRPTASAAHLIRAGWITRRRGRRRIEHALRRALEAADAPDRRLTSEAPLSGDAIRSCSQDLAALVDRLATAEDPRAQGVAIAHQLAFDGTGPLFFQPNKKRRTERLANTIRSALAALSVSATFDRPGERWQVQA
jgi:hypothetical protein